MKKLLLLALLMISCQRSHEIAKLHILDHNGMSETITNPERLASYQHIDFNKPQGFSKVMIVYEERSTIISYYPSGQMHQKLDIVDGRPFGHYREWHSNGKLKLLAPVVGGKPDIDPQSVRGYIFNGMTKAWNANGHLEAQIPYAGGFLDGISTYYHPNGQIAKEVPFSQGELHGQIKAYDPNGTLIACETYRDGLLETGEYTQREATIVQGEGIRFVPIDNGHELQNYHHGIQTGLVRQFHKSSLIHTYHKEQDVKHGEEITYYPPSPFHSAKTPLPKFSIHWHHGEIHGLVKTWYLSGEQESQREMSRNKKDGVTLAWYEDGSLMLLEEYTQDQLVKGEYFARGSQIATSTVTDGKGIATLFGSDGHPLQKVEYFDGQPI